MSQVSGTHIKRNNLRRKLKEENNSEIQREIDLVRSKIRMLKAQGLCESDFRGMYSDITKLELKLL